MKYFEEKLRRLLRQRNMKQNDLAKAMNVHRNTVQDLMKRSIIKPEILAQICTILNVDMDYFTSNERPGNIPAISTVSEINNQGNITYVPLIAYGGFLQGYANKVYTDSLQRFSLPGVTGEHYAFEVDGMSMYDMASPGDYAIARPEEKLEYMMKGKVYVLQTIDGILIKIFDKITGENASFHSFNKDYDGATIPLKSIKKAYFVSRILKKI